MRPVRITVVLLFLTTASAWEAAPADARPDGGPFGRLTQPGRS